LLAPSFNSAVVEVLSLKNAAIDRITSRISQTPIQEVKQRQKQYAVEPHIQKGRLEGQEKYLKQCIQNLHQNKKQ
jgi:hypothetical protein